MANLKKLILREFGMFWISIPIKFFSLGQGKKCKPFGLEQLELYLQERRITSCDHLERRELLPHRRQRKNRCAQTAIAYGALSMKN
jgi:hypothetical protein